jgi:soluble lytic murein transglycosylase-like protein
MKSKSMSRAGLPTAALFAALLGLAAAGPARADIWGYLDEHGVAHFATEQLDERYRLFARNGQRFDTEGLARATPDAADPGRQRHKLAARLIDSPRIRQFDPIIEKAARQHALDPGLVKAVIAVESAFEPKAVSPKGALGLMQLIPDTAARYGIAGDGKKTIEQKLFDPQVNIQAGARYLRYLLTLFADDLTLALAAYNAGEGAVQRHRNRVPPYPETREYVQLVQQFYALYKPQPVAEQPRRIRMVIPARRNMPELASE